MHILGLPQIFGLFYSHIKKAKLRVFFNNTVEISYTSFGTILNIRMNLLSEKKSLLLEDISIEITHADGDTHYLKWVGITETQSEIHDQNGNRQIVTKDQPAIALNLPQELLTEKFIKFQEPNFHKQDKTLQNELHSHINYLKSKLHSNFIDEALDSTQIHNLTAYRRNYFWWKKGEYTIKLNIKSPDSFTLESNVFRLTLNQTDIDLMKYNFSSLKDFLDCQIKQTENITHIKWNWINPIVLKK